MPQPISSAFNAFSAFSPSATPSAPSRLPVERGTRLRMGTCSRRGAPTATAHWQGPPPHRRTGLHARVETGPKCSTCHGNHDVAQPDESRFFHPEPPKIQLRRATLRATWPRGPQEKYHAPAARLIGETKNISTPPDAFGIPFYYYREHLKSNKIDFLIEKLLKDTLVLRNDSLLDISLKKIRNTIRKSSIDKTFLNEVTALCTQRFGKNKIRFRSSSNCEDEANFNGAGLYTSETGSIELIWLL